MADALDAGMGGLRGQQRIDIRVIEGGEGDEAGGEAVDGGERVEPLGLAQRAFRRGAGIDMDRADDVPTGKVFAILCDAIVMGDRLDAAIRAIVRKGRAQPVVADMIEIPQMDMGIDKGDHASSPMNSSAASFPFGPSVAKASTSLSLPFDRLRANGGDWRKSRRAGLLNGRSRRG